MGLHDIYWDNTIFTLTRKNNKQNLWFVQPLNLRLLDESYKGMKIAKFVYIL